MKLICSESVFPESFWRSRIAACGDGPAVLTVPHVRYHAFYPASSILEDSMLYCSCVSCYRLLEGHRGLLLRPDFLSLRLVAAGSEFVRCNRTAWRMEPGDLMIFHPFHDYEYATGDAGFCEKYSITVKGTALASILRNSSLKDAYYLKLDDISAFREQYFRLERCMKSSGRADHPLRNAGSSAESPAVHGTASGSGSESRGAFLPFRIVARKHCTAFPAASALLAASVCHAHPHGKGACSSGDAGSVVQGGGRGMRFFLVLQFFHTLQTLLRDFSARISAPFFRKRRKLMTFFDLSSRTCPRLPPPAAGDALSGKRRSGVCRSSPSTNGILARRKRLIRLRERPA